MLVKRSKERQTDDNISNLIVWIGDLKGLKRLLATKFPPTSSTQKQLTTKKPIKFKKNRYENNI